MMLSFFLLANCVPHTEVRTSATVTQVAVISPASRWYMNIKGAVVPQATPARLATTFRLKDGHSFTLHGDEAIGYHKNQRVNLVVNDCKDWRISTN